MRSNRILGSCSDYKEIILKIELGGVPPRGPSAEHRTSTMLAVVVVVVAAAVVVVAAAVVVVVAAVVAVVVVVIVVVVVVVVFLATSFLESNTAKALLLPYSWVLRPSARLPSKVGSAQSGHHLFMWSVDQLS